MKEIQPVSILLVDDHQIIREGIATLLESVGHLNIVSTACDGVEAKEYLKKHRVDIVLSDISMPKLSGIELTQWVKKNYSEIKVLMLSMHNDPATIAEAVKAEADGYLLKNTGKKELIEAIEKVVDGSTYYSDQVIPVLAKLIHSGHEISQNVKPLSEREIEILRLVCDDFSTQQIAEQLFISPKTVETHRKNILRKTETRSVVGLMRFALQNRLIQVHS